MGIWTAGMRPDIFVQEHREKVPGTVVDIRREIDVSVVVHCDVIHPQTTVNPGSKSAIKAGQ